MQYNARGLAQYKYTQRIAANTLDGLDPIVPSTPRMAITYDALGRIAVINPDGTYTNASYNPWTTTRYDEKGARVESSADAYGRCLAHSRIRRI